MSKFREEESRTSRETARSGANSSYQHTSCCICLVDKYTPVRCDELGGYICGGCLEKAYFVELERAEKAEYALASVEEAGVRKALEAIRDMQPLIDGDYALLSAAMRQIAKEALLSGEGNKVMSVKLNRKSRI